ncbi:MAG: hypothetical protein ABI981_08945 [Betaproteobacteria bacterium]
MQLTLVVRGLLDLLPATLGAADGAAPALTRLLAAASAPEPEDGAANALACRVLGIARQTDWPVAPWLARGAGLDGSAGYWLCAEPAHFVVNRTDVRLDALVHDLNDEESTALRATLATHFAGDGVNVAALDASHWLLGMRGAQSLATVPPDAIFGEPLIAHLPTGADAARWRQWQSEMQMLLFEHPVNTAREAAARKPVNGIWIWGGGAPALAAAPPPLAALYSNARLPALLASARGVVTSSLPGSLEAMRDLSSGSPALAWLELDYSDDASARIASLATLDASWFAPARGAFHNGTIRELEILLVGRDTTLRFEARRLSLARRLRAWTSAPRLSKLLAAATTR